MFDSARHTKLLPLPWDAGRASAAINLIATDTLAHFNPETFWPSHPLEDGQADGQTSLYCGAAGIIWALEYLRRAGAVDADFDFRPALPHLLAASAREFEAVGDGYNAHGSYLFGDMGAALVAMRLAPALDIADKVFVAAKANDKLPLRELMWGTPGSMLACVFMAQMTREPRWRALYVSQAARLLGELQEAAEGALWVQDLYGRQSKYLGAVHGYAGNMIPLLRGWAWLDDVQKQIIDSTVARTLALNAWHSDQGAAWSAYAPRDKPPRLCQHCHGGPGIVTTFADAPFSTEVFESLLIEAGNLVWHAGPLAKGSNLCHGTAGNGYAFLKLYKHTGQPHWLARARAFAMHAIDQHAQAMRDYGRGRYSLWTGDIGLAVNLMDCMRAEPGFPVVDVF